jgi:hypothetical protein
MGTDLGELIPMTQDLSIACAGAVLFGYVVVGSFFFRFWRQTRARLFACFGVAFFILATERAMMLTAVIEPIHQPWIYCTRLVAFLVIAWAIWDANRPRS